MADENKTIDEYISRFPEQTRELLAQLRGIIKKTVPAAEETISYGIPAFYLGGHYLIYFAGYKKHIGVYPVPTGSKEFKKDFSKYKTSGKGAIQFPLDQPLPINLITRIVRYRVTESKKKNAAKKPLQPGAKSNNRNRP